MSGFVFAAVLGAALLHAAWNALIQSGRDQALDTALIHGLGSLLALPLVLASGLPAPAAWPWLAASAAIHLGYYATLAGAYRHGDLALTYPVMRGLAPMLVALAMTVAGAAGLTRAGAGESLSATGWLGIGGISAGVLLVGLSRRPRSSPPTPWSTRPACAPPGRRCPTSPRCSCSTACPGSPS